MPASLVAVKLVRGWISSVTGSPSSSRSARQRSRNNPSVVCPVLGTKTVLGGDQSWADADNRRPPAAHPPSSSPRTFADAQQSPAHAVTSPRRIILMGKTMTYVRESPPQTTTNRGRSSPCIWVEPAPLRDDLPPFHD